MRYFPKLWESVEKATKTSLTGIIKPENKHE